MQDLQMSENQNEFKCIKKHNQMITTILIDDKLPKQERFLCQECLDNKLQVFESMGLNAMQKIIEDKLIKKRKIINDIADQYIEIIQQYNNNLENLKTKLASAIEIMINANKNWIRELNQKKQDSCIYSFIDESDDYIRNRQQYLHTFQFDFFDKMNYSQFNKLKIGIKQLIEAHSLHQYKEFIKNMSDIKEKRKQVEKVSWQLSIDGDIQLKLLNNSINQDEKSLALAFNYQTNILVTSNNKEIVIWNFNEGKLEDCQKYQLSEIVNCLVFSKNQNIFISGSKEVQIWKEQQKKQWSKSKPYQIQEDKFITCLVLNSKEDLLIQGGRNQIINILAVDFQKNQITYLYQLDRHTQWVSSLSLNNSENLLLSCGYNETIIWKKNEDNKWSFMTEVIKQKTSDDPNRALFLKDDQFIFFNNRKGSTSAIVYQQNKLDFTKNYEIEFLPIPTLKSKLSQSFKFIPELNLLFVTYKEYTYILRKQSNGKFKIVNQQCYKTDEIYGTLSIDGQYLVIYDQSSKLYNIYQIQNN
ncbi:unnamed protein product [Paramecium pentaurelia]|uniref:WD40-repeat-containing domain n=1 Tax=Paramecium pentaurelia TaxID=43138 RepID=A0A8S1V010_9CILI|nr:unnamed protein product [Paramecium pentaurelia]